MGIKARLSRVEKALAGQEPVEQPDLTSLSGSALQAQYDNESDSLLQQAGQPHYADRLALFAVRWRNNPPASLKAVLDAARDDLSQKLETVEFLTRPERGEGQA